MRTYSAEILATESEKKVEIYHKNYVNLPPNKHPFFGVKETTVSPLPGSSEEVTGMYVIVYDFT